MKNQKGFSLVELLVVVIIIAIIAAIAIPNLLASRRAANEASAINSMRTIHSAEATYYASQTPNVYGDMTALSGAGLLDDTFTGASFTKSGYTIAASISAAAAPAPAGATYCASATPIGTNGTRNFAINEDGVIYTSTNATPTANVPGCATGVLTRNGALAVQ